MNGSRVKLTVMGLLILVGSAGSVVMGATPIAYYSFDNPANMGHDDSGHGNDLTMSGAWSSVPGISGGAINLEPSTLVGPNVSTSTLGYPGANGFSVEYWFQYQSGCETAVRDYGGLCGETFGLRYTSKVAGGTADFFVRYDYTNPTIVEMSNLNIYSENDADGWIHLIGSYDPVGYTIKLFVDNMSPVEAHMPAPMRTTLPPYLYINGSSHGTTLGTLDEVKIYNTAIPEPATLSLLLLGGLAAVRRRKA
jgi:hypothetical protein